MDCKWDRLIALIHVVHFSHRYASTQELSENNLSLSLLTWNQLNEDDFVLVCFLYSIAHYYWTTTGSGRHFCIHKTAQHLFFILNKFFKYRPERSSLSCLSFAACQCSYELFSLVLSYASVYNDKHNHLIHLFFTFCKFCQVKNLSLL